MVGLDIKKGARGRLLVPRSAHARLSEVNGVFVSWTRLGIAHRHQQIVIASLAALAAVFLLVGAELDPTTVTLAPFLVLATTSAVLTHSTSLRRSRWSRPSMAGQ